MKLFAIFLFITASLSAQTPPNTNAVVGCWPTNQPYNLCTNYPSNLQPTWTSSTTLTAGQLASTNPIYILVLNAASTIISDMQASNAVAYAAGVSNANWVQANATMLANSNLVWFFQNFPAGVIDSSNRLTTATTDLASWSSGTNSAAQTNAIIARMLTDRKVNWQYQQNELQVFSSLANLLTNLFQQNGSH